MTITFHSSVIIADDVSLMATFYQELLQQTLEFDFGACITFKCGLSIWKPGASHPVARHMTTAHPGTAKFELCFETDDFDAALETLRRHRVRFLHELRTEPWGQHTARFFDPESNLVEIGESIPCFVRRLHREGLSLEAVAEKTAVPLETVKIMCAL